MERSIEEIELSLRRNGIEKFPTPNREELSQQEKCQLIQYVIFGAFYPNYFIRKQSPNDLREVHKLVNGRNPMNSVFLKGWSFLFYFLDYRFTDISVVSFRLPSYPRQICPALQRAYQEAVQYLL